MATCTNRTTADSSSAQLFMGVEECWGGDPLTISPQTELTEVRFTGESLNATQNSVVSDEIRSDSQITDLVRVATGASGDVNFELSYGTFDRFFEGALRNDWTAELDVNSGGSPADARTVVIGSPLTEIEIPGSPAQEIQVGQFIYVTGSAVSPTNNGFQRVTAINGDVCTVTPGFAQAESGTNLRVRGSHLRNGTVKKSFLLAKLFSDISPQQLLYFTGMRVGSANFSITPGQILTGTLGFAGKRGFATTSSLFPDVTSSDAAPSGDVANAVDNVQDIRLDGALLDADITEFSIDVNNNTRDKPAVGVLGNVDIGLGRFNVSGSLTAYFADRVLYDKFLNFTAHSLSFAVVVGSDAYVFFLPSVKFGEGTVVAEGNDSDVVANLSFQARRDPTLGFTFSLDRFSDAIGDDLS
jgi:hypothetical protein